MTPEMRIAKIADHALAARKLALGADEPLLSALLDMLLIEIGKLLAASHVEQGTVVEFRRGCPQGAD